MTYSNDKTIEIISEHIQKLVSKIDVVCFNIVIWQLHQNTNIR